MPQVPQIYVTSLAFSPLYGDLQREVSVNLMNQQLLCLQLHSTFPMELQAFEQDILAYTQ